MRHITFYIILLISSYVISQCSYDENCIISPAFPTICPIQLPDATVGESYSTDLTFWLPEQFEAEGYDVNLDQLVVTQITGLPIGLSAELSNSSMVFYPSESEFGCANVSGVPFTAGDFIVTVSVVANVVIPSVGFEIPYPTEFDLYITVNPGSGANMSFIYSPSNGCEDLNVEFEALITSDEFDVEYVWDFGNGFSSNQQYPPTQLYDQSGDYNVTLTTNLTSTIYTLDSFVINFANVDCWGFDVEEACVDLFGAVECWGDPDLLMKLYDANGNVVYQTDYVTNTSATWSDINYTLNNPPYTISVWDTEEWDDLGGLQLSPNDELATFTILLEDGNHNFSSNCSSGSYSISSEFVVGQSFSDSELVTVFEEPDLETLWNEDIDVVYIDYDNVISYQWYYNGQPIDGADESTYIALQSGEYFVEFITEYGCMSMSLPVNVIKCDSNFTPSIFVSNFTLLTTDTEYEIEWFWNGLFYGEGPSIEIENDGYYWLIASDEFDCNWSSDTIFFQSPVIDDIDNDGIPNDMDNDIDGDGIVNIDDDDVDGDGIPNDIDNDIDGDGIFNEDDDTPSGADLFIDEMLPSSVLIFPNPAHNNFNIRFLDAEFKSSPIEFVIVDSKGTDVVRKYLPFNDVHNVNIDFLAQGRYLICIYVDGTRIVKNIIVQ